MGRGEAVAHAGLAQDAPYVVLHGELGDDQPGGDFFVGETLGNQRKQLLFAAGKAVARRTRGSGSGSLLRNIFEELAAKTRRAQRLASHGAAHSGDNIGGRALA